MTQTFEYKPALLTSHLTVTVSDEGVRREYNGISDTANWSDIATVRFAAIGTHVGESQELEFVMKDGRKLSINRNDPDHRHEDKHDLTYRDMFLAVLKGLVQHRPDLQLRVGQKNTVQWILFLRGVSCILFALGIGIAVTGDGGSERGLLPLGVMLVFGGMIAWSFHPFGPPLYIPPASVIGPMEALYETD